MARRTWEVANKIDTVDKPFEINDAEQTQMRNAKPWEKDPHYFKEVKISAVALIKMVTHARRGGNLEVMGLMQGHIDANTFVVTESFALPVEGTETRVNAQAQAYEYMTNYVEMGEQEGHKHKVLGWYHSHPGYGCWLSGIDVSTQSTNQQYLEPWVAVVIDPLRTMSAGKVDIGAFRTYPKGYKPPDERGSSANEYQSVPLHKIEDFGVHCKSYYPLDVTFFKSALDDKMLKSMFNTYWINTLRGSPIFANSDYINSQIKDLAGKVKQIERQTVRSERNKDILEKVDKAISDALTIEDELQCGFISMEVKKSLFSRPLCVCRDEAPTEEKMHE
ncbi:unnamed protein product, partial [Mesorhabditis belari]|uniref:MPN domain-containing protein n=1 Tax=Mesorhabditis belari TaxID=2138241 RepID=A0AAF3FKZ4_9BILA